AGLAEPGIGVQVAGGRTLAVVLGALQGWQSNCPALPAMDQPGDGAGHCESAAGDALSVSGPAPSALPLGPAELSQARQVLAAEYHGGQVARPDSQATQGGAGG